MTIAAPGPMRDDEFALQQFLTLREEIKETKERLFKVMTFGILGVPAANYLAKQFDMSGLLLTLPALVAVIALLYLSENHGLMRCGRFIKDHVESRYRDVAGWENWLQQQHNDRRSVDRYVAYSFFALFLVYYAATVAMAMRYAALSGGPALLIGLVTVYSCVGAGLSLYLVRNIQTGTDTGAATYALPNVSEAPAAVHKGRPPLAAGHDERTRRPHSGAVVLLLAVFVGVLLRDRR